MSRERLRVLIPQRLDVLSVAMDANVVDQWLWLEQACDLVLWGPGLDGYVAGRPLDAVARDVDADLILLPDFHHGVPGLWDRLWPGAERAHCPVVFHLGDFGSALDQRREVIERYQPDAVLLSYPPSRLDAYGDVLERHGVRSLVVPWGFDASLFAGEPRGDRDIDLLVCGCETPESVYPVRVRVKRAARSLADRYHVVDLDHPGYWETSPFVGGRGQAQFADLLRRTKVATTGLAFGCLSRKYYEAAAAGAVGVGDLPADEQDAARFADCSLVVDPSWDEDRIAAELVSVLDDPARLNALSSAATEATAGCDHRERAHAYAQAFATLVGDARRSHRPRPVPPAAPLLVGAAPEPERVPTLRRDWEDIWTVGPAGASRTRRLQAAVENGNADVCVVALDPDAARHADALLLAARCRASGRVVVRPAAGGPTHPGLAPWAAVAAPRGPLLDELRQRRGRCGPEEALFALIRSIGVEVVGGAGFSDPAPAITRLYALADAEMPVDPAVVLHEVLLTTARAAQEGRVRAARELAGVARLRWSAAVDLNLSHADPEPPPMQDPELIVGPPPGTHFALFDPADPASGAAIAAHAALGPGAPALAVGVPVTAGVAPDAALAALAMVLQSANVDLDACADIALLERPLWDGEVAWLADRCASPEGVADLRV